MIKNFITDTELERFYPDLESYRAGAQVDFSDQINLAFEILLNDFQARGKNPRLLGVPLDLNRDASTTHLQQLVSEALTATDNGYAWESNNERRFHVNITTKSVSGDDWSVILQGSNKGERPTDSDSTWETVATITSAAAVAAAESSTVFRVMYKWYRRRLVATSVTGTLTFTCSVHDTIFDNLIVWKALELVAQGWDTGITDMWRSRVEEAKMNYNSAIDRIVASYDEDEDGIPESPGDNITTSIRFSR